MIDESGIVTLPEPRVKDGYYIYVIRSKSLNKFYIGFSTNPEARLLCHLSSTLRMDARKYGKSDFEMTIVTKTSWEEEARIIESRLIRIFNTLEPAGYNRVCRNQDRAMKDLK